MGAGARACSRTRGTVPSLLDLSLMTFLTHRATTHRYPPSVHVFRLIKFTRLFGLIVLQIRYLLIVWNVGAQLFVVCIADRRLPTA